MRRVRGTTLIAFAINEGVVMVADDLLYRLEDGVAIPAERDVRKVFIMGGILIGTAGTLRLKESKETTSEGKSAQTVSIEYKSEDWIIEFIKAHRSASDSNPKTIADALYEKMRETFKPVETYLEHGAWGHESPGDRFVTYVVAGYPKNFQEFYLFELGTEINPKGNGLRYLPPIRHQRKFPHEFYLGEDEFLIKAAQGVEPYSALLQRLGQSVSRAVAATLPNLPSPLQHLLTLATCLVKVEAQFNPSKVGSTINSAVIDRRARQSHLATFRPD